MVEVDANAISIDQDVSIPEAKRIASIRKIKVIGSLCPTRTLLMGDAGLVEEVTKRCLSDGVDAVAPGCNLELYTPTENLKAMVEATKRHGRPHGGGR
jgi:[methyl-Co(III) methanol-specific corrinoid protein]:coenzyme M methyltransferase